MDTTLVLSMESIVLVQKFLREALLIKSKDKKCKGLKEQKKIGTDSQRRQILLLNFIVQTFHSVWC